MRRDIEIHINTGDIVLAKTNKPTYCKLEWLENTPEGQPEEYLYGEVYVSRYIPKEQLILDGVYVSVSYTPSPWPIRLCFKRMYDEDRFDYLSNPKSLQENDIWFDAKVRLYGETAKPLTGAELLLIDEEAYYLHFECSTEQIYTGEIEVYSASHSDFNIQQADNQNSNLLMQCNPSNNYRYPLTGVGLVRWVNGDVYNSTLAETIQREFAEDGVVIRNAAYTNASQQLIVDANYDELD